MPDIHCEYSPSASKRLILCPGSFKMTRIGREKGFIPETSTPAEEGTLAHAIGEALLRAYKNGTDADLTEYRKDPLYKKELENNARYYAGRVISLYESLPENRYMILESRVSIPTDEIEVFGTADAVLLSENILHVLDFKSGFGSVSAFWDADDEIGVNSQLAIYGWGAYLKARGRFPDIKEIHLHIIQPRRHDSSVIITPALLQDWIETIFKPNVSKCFGKIELNPGPVQCKYCQAKMICPACESLARIEADYLLGLDKPKEFSSDELAALLDLIDFLSTYKGAIEDELRHRMEDGEDVKGYGFKVGRNSTQWQDPEKAYQAIDGLGITLEEVIVSGAVTPTKLRKLLKDTGVYSKEFEELVVKVPGPVSFGRADRFDKRSYREQLMREADPFGDIQPPEIN